MPPYRTILAVATMLQASPAAAGPLSDLLDSLRAYDLNDYALGLALTASGSPYAGGEGSTFAYPYLTSFRHSSLTDDWFLVSEGDLGVRWITDGGWEFGAVGRVQTLGLGNSTDPALRGLEDRNWSVEVAPMAGYRGLPVHVNLKTYFEILGRHGGNQTNLSFQLPLPFSRGYFVPSIELIHRSSAYTDYYFGVDANEATLSRPAYDAGASNAAALGFSWGVSLTDQWLLSGGLRLQYLGDEVADSPIAGDRSVWSARLGLAYNADIFRPRLDVTGPGRQPRVEFRIAAFTATSDTTVDRDDSAGNPGDNIDLENLLGVSDSDTVLQLATVVRMGTYHRLEIAYHEMSRSGLTQAPQDIRFGDTVFTSGSDLVTTFDSEFLRVAYGYSFLNDDQKELGMTAGVNISDTSVEIAATATAARERSEVSTPLPVVGAFGSVNLGSRSRLGARAELFALEFDRLEGSMLYLNLEWQRRFGNRFSAAIGYNYYYTKLESRDTDAAGTLEVVHHGPALTVGAEFR